MAQARRKAGRGIQARPARKHLAVVKARPKAEPPEPEREMELQQALRYLVGSGMLAAP